MEAVYLSLQKYLARNILLHRYSLPYLGGKRWKDINKEWLISSHLFFIESSYFIPCQMGTTKETLKNYFLTIALDLNLVFFILSGLLDC